MSSGVSDDYFDRAEMRWMSVEDSTIEVPARWLAEIGRQLADTRRALERAAYLIEHLVQQVPEFTGVIGPAGEREDDYIRDGIVAEAAGFRALAASEGTARTVTHGRHCRCSACAAEDWSRITGPCGMHGAGCPAVYAPLGEGTAPSEGEA